MGIVILSLFVPFAVGAHMHTTVDDWPDRVLFALGVESASSRILSVCLPLAVVCIAFAVWIGCKIEDHNRLRAARRAEDDALKLARRREKLERRAQQARGTSALVAAYTSKNLDR